MDLEIGPLIGLAAGALAVGFGARSLLHTIRRRREHQHLDRAGLTAHGRVATVEPMQRELNGAAGQPVMVSFPDRAGDQRHGRDGSGLGGYLAREGTLAVVRYSPTDPDLVRVEQLVGWHGPYPVRPDGRFPGLSPLGPLLTLAAGTLFTGLFGALTFGAGNRVEAGMDDLLVPWLPLLFVVIGVGLLVGLVVYWLRRALRRGPPREETVGVVTDVWRKSSGSSRNRTWVYPFTVHFTTHDGREVHTRNRAASSRFRPQPQQQVRVRYDPVHPVRFDVPEVGGKVLGVVVPLFIGVVFVALGSILLVATRGL